MTMLAERQQAPTFLDDLTPSSGLALRRWTSSEYRRMSSPLLFGPDERLELVDGEIVLRGADVPRLFSREEYYSLAERGLLTPDERTELIFGHAIEQQMSLSLGSGLDPFPDVMVLPGRSEAYVDAPVSTDVLLLVEVSDTTLRYDRGTKAAMYAAASIADYWLVNLRARALEVRRQPESGDYLSLEVCGESETVAPLAAPNMPLRVADLLPLVRPRKA